MGRELFLQFWLVLLVVQKWHAYQVLMVILRRHFVEFSCGMIPVFDDIVVLLPDDFRMDSPLVTIPLTCTSFPKFPNTTYNTKSCFVASGSSLPHYGSVSASVPQTDWSFITIWPHRCLTQLVWLLADLSLFSRTHTICNTHPWVRISASQSDKGFLDSIFEQSDSCTWTE